MTTSELSIPVRVLRRNWYLPGLGLLATIAGVIVFRAEMGGTPVGGHGILGLLAAWVAFVFMIATAWRSSYPRAVPALLVATSTTLELDDRSIDAARVTEAKVVPKHGRWGDAVAVLTLRDGEQLSLWMKSAEAFALLTRLGLGVGDARASFRLTLRFRIRLALGYLVAGLPLLAGMILTSLPDWREALSWWCFIGSFVSLIAALFFGFLRGRLRIGVDGFTRRWLWFDRFVRFADVVAVARRPAPFGRSVVDTVVETAEGERIVLRAPEEPDHESDRGVEGRALADHLAAAYDHFQRRGLDEVQLRAMLGRGGRSDEAWFADLDGLLRGGAARYRVATVEPAQVAAVVRDVASPPDVRVAAAAALVRFDPEHRPMVQRAADACAQAELQTALTAVSEAEDEDAVKAALRRMRIDRA